MYFMIAAAIALELAVPDPVEPMLVHPSLLVHPWNQCNQFANACVDTPFPVKPLALKPFVGTPFVGRPFVGRPFVGRPFVGRPFFGRPLKVESASSASTSWGAALSSGASHALTSVAPGSSKPR